MSNQHTQGEWELHLGLDYFSIYTNGKTSAYILDDVPFCVEDNEEGIANLKLMTAAPKLLGFAEHMAGYFANNPHGYDTFRVLCKNAIAAAKGN